MFPQQAGLSVISRVGRTPRSAVDSQRPSDRFSLAGHRLWYPPAHRLQLPLLARTLVPLGPVWSRQCGCVTATRAVAFMLEKRSNRSVATIDKQLCVSQRTQGDASAVSGILGTAALNYQQRYATAAAVRPFAIQRGHCGPSRRKSRLSSARPWRPVSRAWPAAAPGSGCRGHR